ncbi:sigma-70 family RNA polymerase sigma factor [Ruminococcaceae bacterium OttesenSCG-928-A16]|nr:sigma-70 family RNA polymerase sigma factor [Ruminococcaceae bacterium OttesenSCG-928-A16]
MATINLRDFYPWYTHDEFVEVPDIVAEELLADRRYQKAHRRRVYRNKSQYSLDADDGIENAATFTAASPFEVMEYKRLFCRLCRALNSLPEVQGKRIEAHYILGKSITEIARAEGVGESAVRDAINRGLRNMKKYLNKI